MIIADIMMSLMSKGKKYRGKVDLLVDGSPCQSFSAIGFREGLKDKRGLLTHNKGETWKQIFTKFKETGYYLKYQLLNAKDYGMPLKHR